MLKEEYIETIYINGKRIDVGIDDYGQCYFFEYLDDEGVQQQVSCGTYNIEYRECIYAHFDTEYKYMAMRDLIPGFDDDFISDSRLYLKTCENYKEIGIDYDSYKKDLDLKIMEYKSQGLNYIKYWIAEREKQYEATITYDFKENK